ncbi:MAG: hypothetical protein AAGF11_15415 [Myxococcota bacterium]
MTAAALLAAAITLVGPRSAQAASSDDRPWGKGTLVPTFGLGAGGFFSDLAYVGFGLGFNYYLINGLSAGLSLSDTILIYRSSLKAQYPGIERELPTNIFDITPTLQYVFFRSRRFSPYVYSGVGPVFFNHGAGTHGQWVAGPGVFFNVAGPVYLNVSVAFSGMFPAQRCRDALTYDSSAGPVQLDLCSFQWGPQIGAVLAFGGRRAQQRRRERERREQREPPPYYDEPASNPLDEAVEPQPEPALEPEPIPRTTPVDPASPSEGAPTEVAPLPSETAPTDAAPPPSEGAPTEGAPPPSEGAPTDVAPPPAEGAPTDVTSPVDGDPANP